MKNKPNICFLCGDISGAGGTEKIVSIITNELIKKNKYNIFILSIENNYEETFFKFSKKVTISKLNKNNKIFHKINYLLNIHKIRKFIKNNKIDIMIDVDIILDILTLPAILGLKTKLISWENFNVEHNLKIKRRKLATKLSVKFSDYIVTLTEKDKYNYNKILGRKEKIIVISNPIEITKYKKEKKKKQIISIGKLLPIKGYDLLIEVAKQILTNIDEWKWIILGDGPEKENLQRDIEANKLQEKILLLGKVKEVDKFYEESEIFVLPSRDEGFGIVLLEAKKHKLPIVCFDIETGPRELVRNEINGFLIEKYNTDKMAEQIKKLIDSEELRKKFSKESQLDLEKYDIDNIIRKWEHIFDSLTERK